MTGVYIDVDPGSEVGVAVVGVDLRYRVWQWWCPQSKTWQTFVGDIYYGVDYLQLSPYDRTAPVCFTYWH